MGWEGRPPRALPHPRHLLAGRLPALRLTLSRVPAAMFGDDGHRVGADAVARDAAGGVGGAASAPPSEEIN